MKHLIKKYSYLFKTAIKRFSKNIFRRLSFYFNQIDPFKISPLESETLTYPVDWRKYFEYKNLNVELGTGHGELLRHLSDQNKENLYVGFEITKTYSLKTSKELKEKDNALVFKGDGYRMVLDLFKDQSINKIYILFPDPWHKKKHHKRRPITSDWLKKIYQKLDEGGEIFFASDWEDYYVHVLEQLYEVQSLYKIKSGIYNPHKFELIETHYYKKWLEMGRNFKYIQMIRK